MHQLLAVQLDPDNLAWIERITARDGSGKQSITVRKALEAWAADPDKDMQFRKRLASVQTSREERTRRSFRIPHLIYRTLKIEAIERDQTLANIVAAALARYREQVDDALFIRDEERATQ